jgi:hypothetical protein
MFALTPTYTKVLALSALAFVLGYVSSPPVAIAQTFDPGCNNFCKNQPDYILCGSDAVKDKYIHLDQKSCGGCYGTVGNYNNLCVSGTDVSCFMYEKAPMKVKRYEGTTGKAKCDCQAWYKGTSKYKIAVVEASDIEGLGSGVDTTWYTCEGKGPS